MYAFWFTLPTLVKMTVHDYLRQLICDIPYMSDETLMHMKEKGCSIDVMTAIDAEMIIRRISNDWQMTPYRKRSLTMFELPSKKNTTSREVEAKNKLFLQDLPFNWQVAKDDMESEDDDYIIPPVGCDLDDDDFYLYGEEGNMRKHLRSSSDMYDRKRIRYLMNHLYADRNSA